MEEEEEFDLNEVRIPEYIVNESSARPFELEHVPHWPMLVFVNTRSGNQVGITLLETLHSRLNSHQVFDMDKCAPDTVLERILKNMENLKGQGDKVAWEVRRRLRIVVAGGDGTAGWLLGVLGDLKLSDPPPVATVPFGTGNNIPFSFGWGKKNPGTDIRAVRRLFKGVAEAYPITVDSWHVALAMEGQHDLGSHPPVPLHVFRRSEQSCEKASQLYRGGFWNYFAIGMDAQVAYAFHTKRQQNPEKFKNQLTNQSTYAKLGCTQGWFCVSCLHPFSRNIGQLAKVYIAEDSNAPWKELCIPSSIRSLVLLNLPGLDPWGTPNDRKSVQRGLTNPSVNDGMLEIVGFRDAWHGLFVLLPKRHSTRLAPAHRVKLEFKGKPGKRTYMHMDGEPWEFPPPEHDKGTVVEVSHHGQSALLARKGCIAENKEEYQHTISFSKKGIEHGLHQKPVPPRVKHLERNDSGGSDESKNKFGAAPTLRT